MANPIKDINWAIDANFPPAKSWTCKRGHNYHGVEVKWVVIDGEGKTARSGPLCPLCVLDFVNREFPVFEVEKDG